MVSSVSLNSNSQVIHGLVQRIMEVLGVPCDPDSGYCIKASNEAAETEFLPGSKGSIIHGGECVGSFGIVHPEVLNNFKINFPCSYMEIDLQCFFK
ncbi:Phenylalanine--trna ligase beta subunit [Thalictrum thalictroides]|uniref:Phenylalanine--trna ligase beta subunit n=1 Tax=Thalictrum thalictroides TaxID=46969 RepID=A0A7J6WXY1_THATH|nr:Phenylalanine--trna ligase beta subunit [Thalictrum thalictroides]